VPLVTAGLEGKNMIELLSPAGSYESFIAAIGAGADAIYVGGNRFGARAYANNFSHEELVEAIHTAHLYQRKLFLTLNTLIKESEIKELYDFLAPLYEAGLDAVIVQDLGVISFIKKQFSDLPIHASTQMSLTAAEGAKLLKELGAERIVTAREITLKEIKDIHSEVDIEIESFIHGAMCYSYSGQCLFSSILGGRSGNRGRCAQPCRLPYDVYQQDVRLNKYNEQYVLSMKDMCTLSLLPDLIDAGIDSFKIEGRMKKPEYTAGVTSIYRKYFDLYMQNGREGFVVDAIDQKRLLELYSRSGSETGFYEKTNGRELITLSKPNYESITDSTEIKALTPLPIEGICTLKKGEPSQIRVSCGTIEVLTKGINVEQAMKQPLSNADIEKQLKKTGNSLFTFKNLIISSDEDIFLPVKELNNLRREAIQELQNKLLEKFQRKPIEKISNLITKQQVKKDFISKLAVLVETIPCLESLSSIKGFQIVYIDSECLFLPSAEKKIPILIEELKGKGCKVFLALPFIFRKSSKEKVEKILDQFYQGIFDGYLARNYEELYWCKERYPEKEIICDYTIYTRKKPAVPDYCSRLFR
jgi:putative protease